MSRWWPLTVTHSSNQDHVGVRCETSGLDWRRRCVVMLSIMMLRLLMAMMTNTFNRVVTASVRHWRVQFTRCVLLVELVYSDPAVGTTGLELARYGGDVKQRSARAEKGMHSGTRHTVASRGLILGLSCHVLAGVPRNALG